MSKKKNKTKAPIGKELENLKKNKKINPSTKAQFKTASLQDEHYKHIVYVENLLDKTNWGNPNTYTNILKYIKKHNLKEYPFVTIKLLIKTIPEYIKYIGFMGKISKKELLQIKSSLDQALKSIPINIKSKFDNLMIAQEKTPIFPTYNQSSFSYPKYKIIRWILNQNYYFLGTINQELGNYDHNYYKEAIKYLSEALEFYYIELALIHQKLAINYYLLAEYYKKEYFKEEYSKENNSNLSEDKNLLSYIENHREAKQHYKEYVNGVTEKFKTNSKFKENINKTYYKYRAVNEYTLQSLSTPYVYFANSQELNDPIDLFGVSNIFISLDPEFTPRIFSMSVNNHNTVMWGHYADGHKGIVIAYCFQKDEKFLKEINNLTAITYLEKRNYDINSTEDILKVDTETKYVHWQYEEEYRFLRFHNNGVLQHKPNCIKAIYFGLKCSKENKKIIHQILSTHQVKEPIKYYQITLPNNFSDFYQLKAQEIFWDSTAERFTTEPTLEK